VANVIIQVKSTVTLNGHTEIGAYSVKGEWIRKNNAYYLLYSEPEDKLGNTRTTIRAGQDSIRVVRHGDVQMNIEFRPGQSTKGSHQTLYGTLFIEAFTIHYEKQYEKDRTKLAWTYDLRTNDEANGQYTMEVWIQEEGS
jgi:uncharacterized beta-barrel protein YwiB (DUF1934 family)